MEGKSLPERFRRIAGPLPDPGTLAPEARGPYESISPAREGFFDNDGVKIWYGVWGEQGPWLAFAPSFQMVHSQMLKGVVSPDDPDPKAVRGRGLEERQFWQCQLDFVPGRSGSVPA